MDSLKGAGRGRKATTLIGYGVGDFGLNIYWNALSLWLVYWYTDIIGLDPQVAGLIFFVGMAWDAISDPIVAGMTERVRTRFGTYRPFLLFGGVALGLCFIALYWAPPLTGSALIAAMVAMILIFRTSYTLVAIPYAAMASRLTYNSVERTELSGVRMFFAFCGLLTVTLLLPPLARYFSEGYQYSAAGFQSVMALGAAVATVALVVCFFFTRELPVPGSAVPPSRFSFRSLAASLFSNRALLILLVVIFLQSGATAALMISMVFFIESNAASFAPKEIVMTSFAFATLLGVPGWTLMARHIGKKKTWIIAAMVAVMSGLHMLVFGALLVHGVPLQLVGFGFSSGAFAVLLWSFIPDAVEYGQYRSGKRSEGLVFGSVLVAQKLSGGLMAVLVTWILTQIGYDASEVRQSTSVGEGLVVFLAICPAALLALSVVPICLLPLNRRIHADIVDSFSSQPVKNRLGGQP